jgi:glutamate racemase
VDGERAIGVFDSGVGGLTVARAIMEVLPHEPILYLGDGARSPYGPRPVDEIRSFGMQLASWLVDRDVKMLVVACNSIEVSAIGDIAASHDLPVVGVVNPGARAAIAASRSGVVGVIGTVATIETGAYQRAVGAGARLYAVACPAFVDHVERGDTESDALREAARGYLAPLREEGVDTVILGCTHYPLLTDLLQDELGPDVVLVSSADETARDVASALARSGALRAPGGPPPSHRFTTTGDAGAFRGLASMFLGRPVDRVEEVHLGAVAT